MNTSLTFNEVLESIDNLSLDEQESIVDILQHRIAARRREEIVNHLAMVKKEYLEGKAQPATAQEIMQTLSL